MVSQDDMLPYHCGPCNITVNFTGSDLHSIMLELPK